MENSNDYLECPCCGDVGAVPDSRELYWDGQSLLCGCEGSISCDSETEPWINADCRCDGHGFDITHPWPCVWNPRTEEYDRAEA